MSNAKTNGYFCQFSSKDNTTRGSFASLMAVEDSPDTMSVIRDDLDKQWEAKRKEEMIEKKSLEKAKEELVEASYYWEMYHSEVCWKGK